MMSLLAALLPGLSLTALVPGKPRLRDQFELPRVALVPPQVSRRHVLAGASVSIAMPPSRHALALDFLAPVVTGVPDFFATKSGIVYYDQPLGSGCALNRCEQRPKDAPIRTSAALTGDGTSVMVNYRLRSSRVGAKGQDGEVQEASDSIGLGSVRFVVGDGSVNAAVDELVRTLPPMTTRRATVPASFDLDRSGSQSPSFLEVSLRKRTASNPTFACSDVDGACICVPGAGSGGTDLQPKTD